MIEKIIKRTSKLIPRLLAGTVSFPGSLQAVVVPVGTDGAAGMEMLYKSQKEEKGESMGIRAKLKDGKEIWIYSKEISGTEFTLDDSEIVASIKGKYHSPVVSIEIVHTHPQRASGRFKISPPSFSDVQAATKPIKGLNPNITVSNSVIDGSFVWKIKKSSTQKNPNTIDQKTFDAAYYELLKIFPPERLILKKSFLGKEEIVHSPVIPLKIDEVLNTMEYKRFLQICRDIGAEVSIIQK